MIIIEDRDPFIRSGDHAESGPLKRAGGRRIFQEKYQRSLRPPLPPNQRRIQGRTRVLTPEIHRGHVERFILSYTCISV